VNSESWRQVEELYHAALEQHPAQRGAFLAERAVSEEVRREVISLLEQSDSTDIREPPGVPFGTFLFFNRSYGCGREVLRHD